MRLREIFENKQSEDDCPDCKGEGFQVKQTDVPPYETTCDTCGGSGKKPVKSEGNKK